MERAVIYIDPRVEALSDTRPPANWHQRALYLGTNGAAAWRRVASATPYLKTSEALDQLGDVIDGLAVSTVVSLGPGDGDTDAVLMGALTRHGRAVQYVPVDLNVDFIRDALRAVGAKTAAPVGISTDFESRGNFIDAVINVADPIPRPALVTLLGGTLGNLDLGEVSFLRSVRQYTRSGDYVVIELPTRPHCGGPVVEVAEAVSAGRDFLANGIARQIGLPVDAVRADGRGLSVSAAVSDIPGAEAYAVEYRNPTGELTRAIKACRYDWHAARDWFAEIDGFQLVAGKVRALSQYRIGFGVVLLQCQ